MAELKYSSVAEAIRQEICSGKYGIGDKLPTEKELEDTFCVSRQTVRKAISELKKQNIVQQRQGSGTYVSDANPAYRAPLIAARSKNIGVLSNYISNHVFPDVLRGIERVLTSNGYSMSLAATGNRFDAERTLLKRYLDNHVAAVIGEGVRTTIPNPNLDLYDELIRQGIPVVFFHERPAGLSHCPLVTTDDFSGGKQAAEELIRQGCHEIGGIFRIDALCGLQRFSGFCTGLMENGMTPNDSLIQWFSVDELSDEHITSDDRWLPELINKVDGLVCYSDTITARVIRALHVDKDSFAVKIVSFDRLNTYALADYGILSLGHPKDRIGEIAAQKVIAMMNGHREEDAMLPWLPFHEAQ